LHASSKKRALIEEVSDKDKDLNISIINQH